MEFRRVVSARRMVRRYRSDPVDSAALERVLAATLSGPSAGFSQGVRLVVVSDQGRRSAVAQLCGEDEHVARGRTPWLSVAPVHVVLCIRPDDYTDRYAEPDKAESVPPEQWPVPLWWVDAGAAMGLLLLAAVDEGLGAGVLQIEDPPALQALLGIPDDVRPVVLATLGHPAPDDRPVGSALRARRPTDELVHHEAW